jgi:hypothetical protein
MKKIIKAYYYLFYKLYKWYESGPSIWWSDGKAVLSIDVLCVFIGISIMTYYTIFIDRYFRIGDGKFFLLGYVLLIATPNYFIFNHRNRWKQIVKEFEKLPKRKNEIGGWIVFGVVLLIITNMVYAFFLMSQIDWSRYR